MTVFGPFCMAHSFVMAGEICSMRHTKHEHQRWWHVCHRLRPSRPTNEFFVFAVEKGPPRKCSRFSGADRFGPCRLHTDIYEPIVNCLGIAGGIVKRGALEAGAGRIVASATRRGYARNGQLTAFSAVSILGSNGSATKRDLPGFDLGDPILVLPWLLLAAYITVRSHPTFKYLAKPTLFRLPISHPFRFD